tara:strand:- start:173 stop:385 length:213 start_codon:yes stop_codon:yes gene_type:complete
MSLRNRVTWDGKSFDASLADSLEEALCYLQASERGWCDLGWNDEEEDLTIRWTDEGLRLIKKQWQEDLDE